MGIIWNYHVSILLKGDLCYMFFPQEWFVLQLVKSGLSHLFFWDSIHAGDTYGTTRGESTSIYQGRKAFEPEPFDSFEDCVRSCSINLAVDVVERP